MDVKKERRKKPTFYLCGRVVVNADGRVGGRWHYGCQERKNEKPTLYLCGRVVVNANGRVDSRWRRRTVVVAAVGTMNVKNERKKKKNLSFCLSPIRTHGPRVQTPTHPCSGGGH